MTPSPSRDSSHARKLSSTAGDTALGAQSSHTEWKTMSIQPPPAASASVTQDCMVSSVVSGVTDDGVRTSNGAAGGIDSAFGQPSHTSGSYTPPTRRALE